MKLLGDGSSNSTRCLGLPAAFVVVQFLFYLWLFERTRATGDEHEETFFMHENEILVLLLGSIVGLFIGLYRRTLSRLPAAGYLFASYLALWLAWIATNVEHLALPSFFNLLEHVGYAANGLLLIAWCWFGLVYDRASKATSHD